jgi:hypothetical protein
MNGGVSIGQFCLISVVQVCGLASAALARISEGGCSQGLCYRIYLALLVLVAFMTVLNLWNPPQQWILSAVTLAIMVITATCDFRRPL